MKKLALLLMTVVLWNMNLSNAFSQIQNPVTWKFSVKKLGNCEAELIAKATIEKGWHLYSQYLESSDGPVATLFTFEEIKSYKKVGKTKEGTPKKVFDSNFGMNVSYFGESALFTQKIKVLSSKNFTIKGNVYFMVCDDKMCLPPEEKEFEFSVEGELKDCSTTEFGSVPAPIEKVITVEKTVKIDSAGSIELDSTVTISADVNSVSGGDKLTADVSSNEDEVSAMSPWTIFIEGFLGGLLALLTPCVFPMIPLTVSFFTKQSKTRAQGIRNAWFYGLSIIVIYVLLGMLITLSLGPDALNSLASNVYMNMAFFLIFVVFAISFLGAFEITLPSSWVNKADAASEKGGLIGIFFMAFTLSLVSFSCTGPIIGTLLVQAAVGGNVVNPVIGMVGFSTALAAPFALFAAFPGWLNSLPKSGGWLNSVKVVLGLLELALALKFFSNVDLAYHWGILTREIFIALWIIIFAVLGFYLLGKIKLSHDSDLPYVSIPRLLMSIIIFSFVVYLIPGMWGAPLKLISGFPPPAYYTEGWKLGGNNSLVASNPKNMVKGIDREHCPHDLSCFHDYDLALAYAREQKKPLMVDFTGYSCVNCRKMEDQVWIDPRVLERLERDYVLVSLYVDDKTQLPEADKYLSETTGKKVKTYGNKWSDMQTKRYGTNSQPYYVLLDNNEKVLTKPTSYDPDIEKYIHFLDEGKNKFNSK